MDDGEKQVESRETHTSNDALCERTTCEVCYVESLFYILSSIITLYPWSSYFNSFSAKENRHVREPYIFSIVKLLLYFSFYLCSFGWKDNSIKLKSEAVLPKL